MKKSTRMFAGPVTLALLVLALMPAVVLGQAVQWTQRSVSGLSPRIEFAMVYDSARGVTVLFGGYDANSHFFSDTWEPDLRPEY